MENGGGEVGLIFVDLDCVDGGGIVRRFRLVFFFLGNKVGLDGLDDGGVGLVFVDCVDEIAGFSDN